MTLRDEIIKCFKESLYGYRPLEQVADNIILNILKPRLEEIRDYAFKISSAMQTGDDNTAMAFATNKIILLCNIDEPEQDVLQIGSVVYYLGKPLGIVDEIRADGVVKVVIRGKTDNKVIGELEQDNVKPSWCHSCKHYIDIIERRSQPPAVCKDCRFMKDEPEQDEELSYQQALNILIKRAEKGIIDYAKDIMRKEHTDAEKD